MPKRALQGRRAGSVVPCCPCTCPANSARLGTLYSPYLSRGPIAAPGASGENCTEVDQSRSFKSGEVRAFNVRPAPLAHQMAASDLTIQPSELKFRFELRKNIPVTLSLHNPGQERVAFKVKTTSPKKYCVRPSSGIVDPGTTKDVQVIMQAQREYPPTGLQDCKDKFLVQTVKVPEGATDITPELFDGPSSALKQTKLRVVLVGPPKPPSPVPEGIEEESATPDKTAFSEPTAGTAGSAQNSQELSQITQERNKLRETLQKVEQDKANIKKRLEQLQLQSDGRVRADVTQKSLLNGPYTLVHLLVIALLAFFLGHFL